MKQVRDYYSEVNERVANLPTNVHREVIGHAADMNPLFLMRSPNYAKNLPAVMLTGGVHGDEPAGVHTVLQFFEGGMTPYLDKFRFMAIPCVNPYGFEYDQLANSEVDSLGNQLNLNRCCVKGGTVRYEVKEGVFEDVPIPREVLAFRKAVDGEQFLASVDHHEDYPDYVAPRFSPESHDQMGYYLYETQEDHSKRIGRTIVDILRMGIKMAPGKVDEKLNDGVLRKYGDQIDRGLISYPEMCGNDVYAEGTSFDSYLHDYNDAHSFTVETPNIWDLRTRVHAHTLTLQLILEHIKVE